MTEILFTLGFKRRLKALRKRYPQIRADIQPIVEDLQAGNFVGDQISGTKETIFKVRSRNSKVRSRNSDIPVGKSGGYRLIYQLVSPEQVLLLLIYAKSDQADVSVEEIKEAVKQASQEKT